MCAKFQVTIAVFYPEKSMVGIISFPPTLSVIETSQYVGGNRIYLFYWTISHIELQAIFETLHFTN